MDLANRRERRGDSSGILRTSTRFSKPIPPLEKINDAIDYLTKSLDPALWVDDSRLNAPGLLAATQRGGRIARPAACWALAVARRWLPPPRWLQEGRLGKTVLFGVRRRRREWRAGMCH